MASLQKNVASQKVTFTLVNATTGAALVTATFTSLAWVTVDGTQAGFAGTFTTLGNGQFQYAPTQGETNGTDVGILITVAGAVPVNLDFHTDPGVLLTSGTGANQIAVDGAGNASANLVNIAGSAVSTTTAQLGVNTVKVNNVSAASVTTIDAVLGTTSNNTPQTGDAYALLGAPAGASVSADVAAIKSDSGTTLTDAAAIKAQTDKLAFTVSNQVDANPLSINGSASAAANVSKANQAIVRGTCSGGTLTTAVCSAITTPASLTDAGQLIGRTIIFDSNTTTANLQGQASNITASTTGATPTLTFTAMTHSPANGDTFSVV